MDELIEWTDGWMDEWTGGWTQRRIDSIASVAAGNETSHIISLGLRSRANPI